MLVVLLLAGASWYAITFNDWRLVAPMDFGASEEQEKDEGIYLMEGVVGPKARETEEPKDTQQAQPGVQLPGGPGLPGQNLDRARTQFKLVADMEAQWDQMNAIVAQYRRCGWPRSGWNRRSR